jgi:hypothetical protein
VVFLFKSSIKNEITVQVSLKNALKS